MKKPNLTLSVNAEAIAAKVLITPDNESCTHVAETYLKNTVKFNDIKNFLGYTGTYLDKPVTVISAGIGMAQMGILAEDLYENCGVESIIYVGLCDSLTEEILPKEYALILSAATDSNYPDLLGLPGAVAPTADFLLTKDLYEDFLSRKQLVNFKYERPTLHVVTTLSSDRRITDELEAAEWTEGGVSVADTATAALFVKAQKAGKKAAALLLVDRNAITGEDLPDKEYQRTCMRQIVLALSNI